MNGARPVISVLILLAAIGYSARVGADRLDAAPSSAPGAPEITAEQRALGLQFAPGVSAGHQQAVLAAIASARPEAQRLIGIVDGRVRLTVGVPPNALGLTEAGAGIDGYRVTVDLDGVYTRHGQRGISRLVLHELGHVVDHALLTDSVKSTLDAGVPAGVGCEEGNSGGCAAREERFAETFAKWATNDVGHNLYIGYKVPPPASLDAWAVPLASVS